MKPIAGLLAFVGVAFSQATPTQTDWIYQVKNKPFVDVRQYNYPAQTPGGTLTASILNTVTMKPCPAGVTGTDTRLRFYITGGSGTTESVASVGGGTCVSGSNGTVRFVPQFSHSGAWTISSSGAGIYEAVAANPFAEVVMPKGTYIMRDCLYFNANQGLILSGVNSETSGTFLNFGGVISGCSAINFDAASITSNAFKILRHFNIQGTGTTVGGHGIFLQNTVRVVLDDVTINSFAGNGLYTINAFEVTCQFCQIGQNGQWGILMFGTSNLSRIIQSYIGSNSRLNGYGGIQIVGPSSAAPSQQVLLDGVDVEASGLLPFTTVTATYGIFLQNLTGVKITNSYVEGNVGTDAILYQDSVTSIYEDNTFINSGHITYGDPANSTPTVNSIRSSNMTFYGAAAFRTTNPHAAAVLGPDSCLSGSTECTTHPLGLGAANVTGSGSAALGANSPATTNTAPYTWMKSIALDGSVVYVPAWK